MSDTAKPVVISAPDPRDIDLIFTPEARDELFARYQIVECKTDALAGLPDEVLASARYVLGQPPIDEPLLARMTSLKAVLNVEGNLFNNMPYDRLFERGIYTLTTMAVFAEPVAELGLGMALDLARNISGADRDFQQGVEAWGLESNTATRLISGSTIGFIGFGELGRALHRLLAGFGVTTKVYDPWLPPSVLKGQGVAPATLDEVLSHSDFVFVVAAITSENEGFLAARQFAQMKQNASLILLSRAAAVDFDSLLDAVARGHIKAASDVFPQEPMPIDHRVRRLEGFLRSAHRAGAMDVAFKRMGEMVLEDTELMDRGLPPMRCRRAERETVAMMRSMPVKQS